MRPGNGALTAGCFAGRAIYTVPVYEHDMKQLITGYHSDDESDWLAKLACGHLCAAEEWLYACD